MYEDWTRWRDARWTPKIDENGRHSPNSILLRQLFKLLRRGNRRMLICSQAIFTLTQTTASCYEVECVRKYERLETRAFYFTLL